MDKLGPKADRVQPIFITVDPKRDTPEVVKQYVAAFSPRLIGLTGTPEQIATVAKEYRVYYADHQTEPGSKDYSVDHSSVLYLMGPDGKFVGPIRPDEDGAHMAADLDRLMS
jgi:protein SCO1/2